MEEYLKPVPETPVADSANGTTVTSQRRQPHAKPGRALPTDRMKFEVQVNVLRAFADQSGPTKRRVKGDAVGSAVGVHPGTAALCNKFFVASGWITQVAKGEYVATDELWQWFQRDTMDGAEAKESLRRAASGSWYWEALGPRLSAGPTSLQTAILTLMEAGGAHTEHMPHLNNLVQWLVWLGLAVVEDDRIRAAPTAPAVAGVVTTPPMPPPPAPESKIEREVPPAPEPESTTVQPGKAPAVLAHRFDVHLTADDLAMLTPEQIKALFEAFATIAAITSRKVS